MSKRCILKRGDGRGCTLADGHAGLCVFDTNAPPAPSFNPHRRTSRDDLMAVRIPLPSNLPFDTEPPAAMPKDEAVEAALATAQAVLSEGPSGAACQELAAFVVARFGGVLGSSA